MSVTNQIVLNGLPLPQASFDRYACWEESLTRQLDMISGRRVLERIGRKWKVWRVRWACDYLEDEICQPALEILRSGGPLTASVLPDNGGGMVTASFVVESVTDPTFLIDDDDRPVWHGLGFTLREERPHA